MCHQEVSVRLPDDAPSTPFLAETRSARLEGLSFGTGTVPAATLILPDIYGLTPFYRGFAAYLAREEGRSILLDPFAGHGDLPEATRDAAFARRHLIADCEYVDAVEAFVRQKGASAVVGFCLGGNFVLELARRNLPCKLIAIYPFPQGLANRQPLAAPFEWLPTVSTGHAILIGAADASVGLENVARLQAIAADNPAIDLTVYAGAGHGFMSDLDSDDAGNRATAEEALRRVETLLTDRRDNRGRR